MENIIREPTYHQLKKQYPDKPEQCLRCKLFTHCKENQYKIEPVHAVVNSNFESVVIITDTPPPLSDSVDPVKHWQRWVKDVQTEAWDGMNVFICYAVSCSFPNIKLNMDGDIPKKYIDQCGVWLSMALANIDDGYKISVIVTHGKASKQAAAGLGTNTPIVEVPYLHPEDDWQRNRRDKFLMRVQNCARGELVPVPGGTLEQVLRQAKSIGKAAIDFEWSPTTGKLHTVSIASKDFAWAGHIDKGWTETKRLFADPNMTIVGHDLARAEVLKMLEMGVREINCSFRDGLIRTWELRGETTRKAKLKDIVWADTDLEKYWGNEDVLDKEAYKELMETPSQIVTDICRGDAYASYYYDDILDEDFPEQVQALRQGGAEDLDHRMILPTAVMMWKGIGLDRENVEKREKYLMDEIPKIKEYVNKEHGIDPGKPQQVLKKIHEYGGQIYNTEAERLKELQQVTQDVAIADLVSSVLKFRDLNTVYTRYIKDIDKILSEDGRIHSYLKIASTVTGRGSSSQPPLQVIPPEIRDIICSTYFGHDGELWTLDRSQSEYRCVAYMSEVQAIIDDYIAGKDLHTFTAESFNIPRRLAKNINFAGIFDATVEKLVHMLVKYGVDKTVATRKAKDFVRMLAPVKAWQRKIINDAYNKGYIETPTGRRSYRLRKQQIVNTPVQGWSADLNKQTVLEFFDEMWARKLESYIWLEFHDGTEINVLKDEAHIIDSIAEDVYRTLPDIDNKGIHLPFPLDKEVRGYYWNGS